jgi:hypothetical protein
MGGESIDLEGFKDSSIEVIQILKHWFDVEVIF